MSSTSRNADALVVFGITGDLARKQTLRSLYRLERRRQLDCPVIGVARSDWSDQRLREHARRSIQETGEKISERVFSRFARRLTYVGGDSADPDTYKRLAAALGDASFPTFYLEIPPSLFATVVGGLSEPGALSRGASASWSRSRSATICARRGRSRATCTATSTSHSCTASITSWARWGSRSSPTCGSRTRCSSRSGTATTSPRFRSRWRRSSASSDAGASTTRSARCATWSKTT